MRFCILGDTHFGVRNDLSIFHGHFDKFYDRMITDLVGAGITDVFQLGDLFDRRKYINFQSTNIKIYDKPTTVEVDGTSIDLVPWICRDNEKEVVEFINSSKSDICFGHFEIAGFAMYRGMESYEGMSAAMFEKYELVCSGHYHTRSKKGNITYVGTPCEMTWQDHNDPKGYHLFNTEDRSLQFFQNPNAIFYRIGYDDTLPLVDLDALDIQDLFIKLVVTNKNDLYKFDQYVQKLYSKGAYEIKIVEDLSEFNDGTISEDINLEDTMDVLSNYIDSIETDADKEKIKSFMKSLYVEAINIEVVE